MLSEGQEETPTDLADDVNAAAYRGYLLTSPPKTPAQMKTRKLPLLNSSAKQLKSTVMFRSCFSRRLN